MKLNGKMATLALSAALSLFIGSAGPVLAAPATATAPTASLLYWGVTGPAVSTLQQQLQTLGYFTYPSITGYYGAVTVGAVRGFQSAYGLTADGLAGPITRQAIDRAITMQQLTAQAVTFTGVRYQWGGANPSGFDCSGFIWYLYQSQGLSLPRLRSQDYYTMGTPVDRAKLQPGDLVFFDIAGPASHMGIYLGDGNWISATASRGIKTYALDNTYWAPKYMGARRI